VKELRSLCRQNTPEVIAELHRLAFTAKSEQVRLAACSELLDRGYGRPLQSVAVEDNRSPLDELPEEQLRELLLELQLRRRERAMRTIDAAPAEIPQPSETVTDGTHCEKSDETD